MDYQSQRRGRNLGYTVVDPPSIIATHLTEVIKSHIHELLTRQDVQNHQQYPGIKPDAHIRACAGFSIGEIEGSSNLLREQISIRDLVAILETLADYAPQPRDIDLLTEYVRQSLKRAISRKFFAEGETTSVVTLDPKVEQEIMDSVKQTEQGSYLALDPEITRELIESVQTEIQKLEDLGKNPIIVTSPIVRYLKRLMQDYFKDLIVISYNEIDSTLELQSVGMVTI